MKRYVIHVDNGKYISTFDAELIEVTDDINWATLFNSMEEITEFFKRECYRNFLSGVTKEHTLFIGEYNFEFNKAISLRCDHCNN